MKKGHFLSKNISPRCKKYKAFIKNQLKESKK